MADRMLENPRAFEKELVTIVGSFQVADGSPDTITNIIGKGVNTVARTGTGAYTITLDDAFDSIRYADVSLQMASATDLEAQIVSNDVTASGPTVAILTRAAAVATEFTDTTADATATVFFKIVVKNSSV